MLQKNGRAAPPKGRMEHFAQWGLSVVGGAQCDTRHRSSISSGTVNGHLENTLINGVISDSPELTEQMTGPVFDP
jgi:hypothetical protein